MAGEHHNPPVTVQDIRTTIEKTIEDTMDSITGTLGKLNLTASICIIHMQEKTRQEYVMMQQL